MSRFGHRVGSVFRMFLSALLIALAATGWCWWAGGDGLGLFLGTLLLAALYLPALALADRAACMAVLIAVVFGTGALWLAATNWTDVSILEWLECVLVFAAFGWAVAGTAWLVATVVLSKPLAAAITLVIALLWLTWPVWLSRALTQPLVSWLVPADPMFAINGVLQHLGAWDRAPLAYNQLTVLNQDVAYHFPRSIWPALLVHLIIGAPGIWLCFGRSLFDQRTRCTPAPAPPGPDTQ